MRATPDSPKQTSSPVWDSKNEDDDPMPLHDRRISELQSDNRPRHFKAQEEPQAVACTARVKHSLNLQHSSSSDRKDAPLPSITTVSLSIKLLTSTQRSGLNRSASSRAAEQEALNLSGISDLFLEVWTFRSGVISTRVVLCCRTRWARGTWRTWGPGVPTGPLFLAGPGRPGPPGGLGGYGAWSALLSMRTFMVTREGIGWQAAVAAAAWTQGLRVLWINR